LRTEWFWALASVSRCSKPVGRPDHRCGTPLRVSGWNAAGRSPLAHSAQIPTGMGARLEVEGVLTVVRLLRREGNRLHVRGLDMLDGTPILDLKPYLSSVPADELKRGWMTEVEEKAAPGDTP